MILDHISVADAVGIGYVATSGLLMLAEATEAIPGLSVVEGLMPITSVGFAVWYGWYVTSRAFPRRDLLHKEQIEALTKTYMDQLERDRTLHNQQAEQLRGQVHELAEGSNGLMLKVVAAIEELTRIANVVKSSQAPSKP